MDQKLEQNDEFSTEYQNKQKMNDTENLSENYEAIKPQTQ